MTNEDKWKARVELLSDGSGYGIYLGPESNVSSLIERYLLESAAQYAADKINRILAPLIERADITNCGTA